MTIADRKQRIFERREEDILDAALALLSHPNWEAVTVEQIANEAEIGKGTFYKHFISKDELLFRLMMRFYSGLLLHLQKVGVEDLDDILVGFRHIFEFAFRYHMERKEYRYIVEYCKRIDFKERADESWRASFLELDRAFGDWSAPLLLAAMEKGLIASRPLAEISIGLQACFNGAVDMLWAGKDWCIHGDEEAIIESVTEFMIAGLVGRA
jgi:AcrR family transcriptional regulator